MQVQICEVIREKVCQKKEMWVVEQTNVLAKNVYMILCKHSGKEVDTIRWISKELLPKQFMLRKKIDK